MKTEKLLRIKQVQQLTALSKSYIYQLCSQNKFPRSIQLVAGGSSVAWVESEINDFIESRIKARNDGEV
jgi:prophage regulatory protein